MNERWLATFVYVSDKIRGSRTSFYVEGRPLAGKDRTIPRFRGLTATIIHHFPNCTVCVYHQ